MANILNRKICLSPILDFGQTVEKGTIRASTRPVLSQPFSFDQAQDERLESKGSARTVV
jgi:hypothetical protein